MQMKLTFYNRNAFGTQFGGSMYSMVDPHLVLLVFKQLGPGFTVWDKGASIEFVRPGKGIVKATIAVGAERIQDIRRHTADGARYLPEFDIDIVDEQGAPVARVHKTLYVRRQAMAEATD